MSSVHEEKIKASYSVQEEEINKARDEWRAKSQKVSDKIYDLRREENKLKDELDARIEEIKTRHAEERKPSESAIQDLEVLEKFKQAFESGTIEWSTAQVHNNYFEGTNAPPPVKLLESYEDSTLVLGLYYAKTDRPSNKASLVIQGFCKLVTSEWKKKESDLVFIGGDSGYFHTPLNDLLWTDEKTHPEFFKDREEKIESGNHANFGKELKFFQSRKEAIEYAEKHGVQKIAKKFFKEYTKARAKFDELYTTQAEPKYKKFYKVETRQQVRDTEEVKKIEA